MSGGATASSDDGGGICPQLDPLRRYLYTYRDDDQDDVDGDHDQDEESAETCGGHIEHIPQAGRFLLDGETREAATFDEDLEAAYRSYLDVMRARGLDPEESRREITEFRDQDAVDDRPPPD